MNRRAFYRVFTNRKHTVQFVVLSTPLGYDVLRWNADGLPESAGFFDWEQHGQSWARCREAAAEFARQRARRE